MYNSMYKDKENIRLVCFNSRSYAGSDSEVNLPRFSEVLNGVYCEVAV